MEAVITDRRDGRPDLSGSWFRIRYAMEAAHTGQPYDLFIPRRPIAGPARITRTGGLHLLCGREEPEYLCHGKALGFDVVSAIFHLVSGQEEYRSGSRDELGRVDEKASFLHRHGVEGQPLVDLYIRVLRQKIAEKAGTEAFHGNWPKGKRFALVLSHDVDTVSAANATAVWNCVLRAASEKTASGKVIMSAAALRRAAMSPLRLGLAYPRWLTRPDRGLEMVCRIEERYGVRSTFFVFAPHVKPFHPLDCPYSYREKVIFAKKRVRLDRVLDEIGGNGWEIGLHGGVRSHADAVALGEQKQAVENALGRRVMSLRQHYLCFETDRTWIAQEGAGLSYDSTHGYNRLRGFRGSCCLPFRPFSLSLNRELDMWEVPLNVQDCAIDKKAGEEGDDHAEVMKLLSAAAETGGVATLSWHPDRFSDPGFRPLAEMYERILRWAQEKDALIGSVGQVMEAWENRSLRPDLDLDLDGDHLSEVSA